MKTILLLISAIILTFNSNSQWQDDFRLTNDTASSYTEGIITTCIASSGNFVHVVWRDNRDGNWELYYKRSSDGGSTWNPDTRLTNNSAETFRSTIVLSGSHIHIFWHDARDGNWEIYYKLSTDNGNTWGSDTRLTNNSAESSNVSASLAGSNIDIVWCDRRNNMNYQIFYKRSTDNGLSWGPDVQLTTYSYSVFSSVSHSGSVVHAAWQEQRDGNFEVYYKRSPDNGETWESDTRLTVNGSSSLSPGLISSGPLVHVAWAESRDGNPEIYYKRSSDYGITWGTDTRLTFNTESSGSPALYMSGSILHLVWRDDRDGNPEIYYKRSVNEGLSWENDIRLTNNSSVSYNPSVSASGTSTNVVWYDRRDGNYEVYYKKDSTGNVIGLVPINTKVPKEFLLSQNYPNPFNPTTNIEFQIPKSGLVNLTIYNALGREVETLINQNLSAGTYKADWNSSGNSSGIYFYKLISDEFTETKKMVLLK